MKRVIGIDPGTISIDVCGLEDGKLFLDTTIPSPDFAANPTELVDLLQSYQPLDLVVAPSGYGLPCVPVSEFGPQEKFLFTLVAGRDRGQTTLLGGLGKLVQLLKDSGLPVLFIPGVIHLPTVPAYRKANKIDMGTADKLCCLALGIADQAARLQIGYAETAFILVEAGGAYTAVMAVEGGKVVDGLGGSVGGPGFYALGGMDGELAYLLNPFPKEILMSGGALSIAGQGNLTPEEFAARLGTDAQVQAAWEALAEGVCKSVAAELAVVERPREILLSGRLCRVDRLRDDLTRRLSRLCQVRRLGRFAPVTKEAAQGAALLADGLAGGQYQALVDGMALRQARGTALDYLYIKQADELRKKYLG